MASNETLFRRYQQRGDVRALARLFDRTADEVLRVAMHLTRDPAQAEECLQQTFLIAIERAASWDDARPFLPWLLGILRNVVRRAHAARPSLALPQAEMPGPVPRDAIADVEWSAAVAEIVERLPDPYRAVLVLNLHHGLAPAEIARLHRIPPASVRSQLHRGLGMVREALPAESRSQTLGAAVPLAGMGVVREHVLAAARLAASAPAATGTVALSALIGGTLMVTKSSSVAAVLVLLLLGGLLAMRPWETTHGDARPDPSLSSVRAADHPELRGLPQPTSADRLAAPPDGPHVACRVVSEDGEPVVGARVMLLPTTADQALDPDDSAVASAVSDAQGRGFVSVGDDAPSWFVFAEADGMGPTVVRVVRPGDDVTVTLTASTTLTGVVRTRDGEPVADARVSLWAMVGSARKTWSTRSDADGAYSIEGLPSSPPASISGTLVGSWIHAEAEGFAPSTVYHQVTARPGEAETHDVVLLRGVTVRGRVVRADTQASVPGATVVLAPSGRSTGQMMVFGHKIRVPFDAVVYGRATADAEGRFVFEHAPYVSSRPGGPKPPGGSPSVFAWSEGTCVGGANVLGADDEGTLEVTIEVHPAAIVVGRLVDGAGEPVRGTRVWAGSQGLRGASVRGVLADEAPRAMGFTDEAGAFRLDGVPAQADGPLPVEFSSSDRPHLGAPYQKNVSHHFTVEPGKTHDLGTLLWQSASLEEAQEGRTSRMRVIDAETRRPVWDAAVGHSYTNLVLRTDRDGRTAITWAGSGEGPVRMLVRASGYATRHVDVTMGGDEQEVRITRERAMLVGAVVGRTGEPIEGAHVEVVPAEVPLAQAFPPTQNWFQLPRTIVGVGSTDRAGRFSVPDLAPGAYHLRARSRLDGSRSTPPESVVVAGLATSFTAHEVVLPLVPQAKGARLVVEIRDAGIGRAVLDVHAALHAGGKTQYPTSGTSVMSVFEAVPDGETTLTVKAEGYVSERRTIVLPAAAREPILVRLQRGTTLRGRVELPAPKDEWGLYMLRLQPTTGEMPVDFGKYLVRVGADGTFATRGLRPGRYHVTATRYGGRGAAAGGLVAREPTVLVPERGALDRNFIFVAAGTLQVKPSDPRLPPTPWNRGSVTPEQSRFGEQSWLMLRDANGNDVARHEAPAVGYAGPLGQILLQPGRYTLHVKYGDDDVREVPVDVAAGAVVVLRP